MAKNVTRAMLAAPDEIPARIRDFLDPRKEIVFRQINDERLPAGEVFKTIKNEGYHGDFHFFASCARASY